MSLLAPDDGSSEPRTHALVIGVGGYRHLQGGSEEHDQLLDHVGLLGQLTSPAHSALAVAEWLRHSTTRLHKPLGSLDLLLSVAPGQHLELPQDLAPGASREQIESAYNGWRDRCDRNAHNVALFYYCGHGLQKGEHFLLAEDFGANKNNPWLGAFDFDTTRLAFNACTARTQCFFVDACRKITSGMMQSKPQVTGLETVNHTQGDCEHSLVARAAARNEEAFGPPGGVSYFAQALLRAFQGAAARQSDSGWLVETSGIAAHLNDILQMMGRTGSVPCMANKRAPLVEVDVPLVPIELSCRPDAANEVAKLSWWSVADSKHPEERDRGPWSFQVKPGQYRAAASFEDPRFQTANAEIIATPPGQIHHLRCQP